VDGRDRRLPRRCGAAAPGRARLAAEPDNVLGRWAAAVRRGHRSGRGPVRVCIGELVIG